MIRVEAQNLCTLRWDVSSVRIGRRVVELVYELLLEVVADEVFHMLGRSVDVVEGQTQELDQVRFPEPVGSG